MKIYYAHCVSIFNTHQEARDIKLLEDLGYEVHNPNNEVDARGYKEFGMSYFHSLITRCDVVAFRALPGGQIPAGIYKEINWAIDASIIVIELPSSISQREMSVAATREYLSEVGQR